MAEPDYRTLDLAITAIIDRKLLEIAAKEERKKLLEEMDASFKQDALNQCAHCHVDGVCEYAGMATFKCSIQICPLAAKHQKMVESMAGAMKNEDDLETILEKME